MNEEERLTQVSALFDGELDGAQADLVVRRVLKDPALRAAWSRYAVIGATVRGEPLCVGSRRGPDVASRVERMLEVEAPLQAAAPLAAPRPLWTRGPAKALAGAALAASVAAVSLLVLRMQAGPSAPALPLVAQAQADAPAPAGADVGAPPSYTTPVAADGPGMSTPLVNYVVAHSEYLTPVMRFNPLSAVMMGSFEPGEELVEATEAEIGASRR